MRNDLKRILTAVLVLVMVLGMLPVAAVAAEEGYTATPISGIPATGVPFVIYAPAGGVAMGSEANSGKTAGFAAASNEENDNLTVLPGTGVFYFEKNSDDTYYLVCGGRYYTATSTSTGVFADAPGKGSKWQVKTLGDGWQVANTDYKYNNNPASLEVYNGAFSPYGFKSSTPDIFTMKFYAVDASADADGDGYLGEKPVAGEKPADGDTVVIYNDYGGACFGDSDGASLASVASTKTEYGNGALIFEVHLSGGYYTFENNGRYLATNAAEDLFFQTTQDDYTKWTLEECTGGYIIYNKAAKYNGNPVCIEYYANAFSGWTFNGSTNLFAMNFFQVEDELGLGYVLNPKLNINAKTAFVGVDYTFEVVADDLSEIIDLHVSYSVDGAAYKPLTASNVDGYSYTYAVPEADLSGGSKLTISADAMNEYKMAYSATKTVDISDEPLIVSVSPASNGSTGSNKRPTITVEIANCGTNPAVEMTLDGAAVTPTVADDAITYTPAANLSDDRHTVSVTITRADGKKAEMVWSFFVGDEGLGLYYGQMHSHTAEYSDGSGTLEDAYEYASKAEDIDFLFVTDHSNYFDTTSTATASSYYDLSSLTKGSSLSKWEEARATAASYTTDDFIAAYGYEMTWSGGPGHTNTFNTYGTVSRNNSTLNNKTDYAGMHLYNDLMVNADRGLDVDGNPVADGVQTKYISDAPVVSQFNHPGTTFGNFDNFAGYTPSRDTVLSLIEVGNGEGAVGGSSYWPSYSEYDLCLSKGWHVAPTNNQDNHKGKWGDSNTCRDVVVTNDFSEAGLYEAMSQRRVYATEDQNLRIYYYLNEQLMGSIIDLGGAALETVNITVSISDPDGEMLGKIEVIGENGVSLWNTTAAGATAEVNVTLPNTDAYYYIKITQADGDIAVTAPVWVGVATPITADLESDAAMSIVGQAETLTTTLTNAAAQCYTLDTITFSLVVGQTETVIETIDKSGTVVAPGETLTTTLDYVRTAAGAQTIQVVYTGVYDGQAFTCQATLESKVYKAEDLVKIGIDYGHGNFYVSGGYSDNMGNFISFCADNGVSASFIQKGEFTYETLSQYAMVILTVPFDTGNLAPSAYTAAELAALKQYAEAGGNLIITTKSDRKSPTGALNCATLTNSLLETVGANVRAANGIIVDNVQKANEAYRIYFSALENFNTEHLFTAGTYTASNAFGTVPAGDNQTGFQLYNAAPILINEGKEDEVEVLVNGYQTTWGASYTNDFNGSSYVPDYTSDTVTALMGEVNIMTYEELSGGGWLITSGCTFFSNYDIKDDQDYVNKFIVKNILDDLTGASDVTVTPIAEVKVQEEGEYTIEGYITSNASGYDQDTAFFDCIYVEDKEGNGINVFPVAGNYCIGMHVRCHGGVTFYCGEVELNLGTDYNGSIQIISDELYEIEPAKVTCEVAMADASIGNLMQVRGKVTEIVKSEGVISKIYVEDATGVACLFINGYIMKDYTGLDNLQVGMTITGVGIGSRDVDESSSEAAIYARLRVRDRSEIVVQDEAYVTSILLTTKPDKRTYLQGEKLDTTGGKLTVTWSDGTVEKLELTTDMVTGFDTATVGKQTLTVSYGGKTTTYMVTVEENPNYRPDQPCDGGANCPSRAYSDVDPEQWYHAGVDFVLTNSLMNGVGNGKFNPNGTMTRAMLVTVLWRYAGSPAAAPHDFTDVQDGQWYAEAVAWAAANGIVNGVGNGKFNPNGAITREQMVSILYRYANGEGVDTAARADLSGFPDAGTVSGYAADAVAWAVAEGIIGGTTSGGRTILDPKGSATRAQVATILMRFIEGL